MGKISKHDCRKFEALLGRPPILWEKTIEDMTWTIIANGLVNKTTDEAKKQAQEKAREILGAKELALEGVKF